MKTPEAARCAHENRETTIGGGTRCKDCGVVVREKPVALCAADMTGNAPERNRATGEAAMFLRVRR